ncbi:hypothetical protein AX16_006131 [Volvariella volvacea WC 439]|nr:hypothetical protein AX16_006131 [Volvariella volvacea WC 439]
MHKKVDYMHILSLANSVDIEDELYGKVCVAPPDAFLETILPVDSAVVENVQEHVSMAGLYDNHGSKWTFDASDASTCLKDAYSHSFVKACQGIADALKTAQTGELVFSRGVDGEWVELSVLNAQSADDYEPRPEELRPKCALVTNTEQVKNMDARMVSYRQTIKSHREQLMAKNSDDKPPQSETHSGVKRNYKGNPKVSEYGGEKEGEESKMGREGIVEAINTLKREMTNFQAFWWTRIHIPIEVITEKRKYQNGLKNLLVYFRHMLLNQLDRRFILGLLLVEGELSVWMCDRSGVLGMQRAINIHQNPERFIHVITALHTLPPERLGWDTTMRLYDANTDIAIASWRHQFNLNCLTDIYDLRWVINMPVMEEGELLMQNGQPLRREYITLSLLYISATEMMYNRATLVFIIAEYCKRKDAKLQDLHVLKQSYRPVTEVHTTDGQTLTPKEADFYTGLNNPNVAKLISWEDVTINCEVDSTLACMRHGLAEIPGNTSRRRAYHGDDGILVQIKTDDGTSATVFEPLKYSTPKDHIHTRLILQDLGISIKFFRTKKELVRILKCIVQGHEYLYKEHQILHRDLSLFNMLIRLNNDTINKCKRGYIIDLDHARRGHVCTVKPYTLPEKFHMQYMARGLLEKVEQEVIEQVINVIYINKYSQSDPTAPDDKATSRNMLFSMVSWYIIERIELLGLPDDKQLSLQDLKWQVPNKIVSFSRYPNYPRRDFRAGTLPFMSHEILSGVTWCDSFYKRRDGFEQSLVHDAAHDMESVFWSLLYLCLTHKSGAGVQRDELHGVGADANLVNVVHCLFNGDEATVENNKQRLFQHFHDMEDHILPHVGKYFEVLKPLLRSWWNILHLAFRYRGFEYWNIHQMFLQAIDDFEEAIHPDSEEIRDYEGTKDQDDVGELECRDKYLTHLLGMTTSQLPVPNDDTASSHRETRVLDIDHNAARNNAQAQCGSGPDSKDEQDSTPAHKKLKTGNFPPTQ